MKSATMRYCGSGVISHELCNHEIVVLKDILRDLLIMMMYLIKSEMSDLTYDLNCSSFRTIRSIRLIRLNSHIIGQNFGLVETLGGLLR